MAESYRGHFSIEVPSSPMMPACVMLTYNQPAHEVTSSSDSKAQKKSKINEKTGCVSPTKESPVSVTTVLWLRVTYYCNMKSISTCTAVYWVNAKRSMHVLPCAERLTIHSHKCHTSTLQPEMLDFTQNALIIGALELTVLGGCFRRLGQVIEVVHSSYLLSDLQNKHYFKLFP